ncbi:MAG: alpha/beta hydrolase [Balneolaceae bacterium]|nr:alpha/beta hydrolase [Balneolaceae bacterium]
MFGETQYNVKQADRYKYIDFKDVDGREKTLVLLHGMFGGLSNFDPMLSRLSGYSVFVPEIPVYSFERQNLTIPKLADWLDELLVQQDISEPILVGNSMGGHIALQHALNFPEKAKALVLTGSSGLFENDLGSSRPRRYDRNYVKERASLTFYEDLVNEKIIDEILEVLQSPEKLTRLLRVARSTHEHNLEDRLSEINQPVLLIWGKNDVITPPHVAEQFLEKLPAASLRWINRCGHAPMMERPDEFVACLEAFLEDHNFKVNQSENERHEEDYTHI